MRLGGPEFFSGLYSVFRHGRTRNWPARSAVQVAGLLAQLIFAEIEVIAVKSDEGRP